jgi:hypothetical protein
VKIINSPNFEQFANVDALNSYQVYESAGNFNFLHFNTQFSILVCDSFFFDLHPVDDSLLSSRQKTQEG